MSVWFKRAVVFTFIGVILVFRAEGILVLLGAKGYAWYVPLLIAIIFALVFAFYPVTSLHSLLLPVVGLLWMIRAVEETFYFALSTAICALVILLVNSIYIVPIYLLITIAYKLFGVLGASIATIIIIAILLATVRAAFEFTKIVVKKTWVILGDLVNRFGEFFPERLRKGLWAWATNFGKAMGGDFKAESSELGIVFSFLFLGGMVGCCVLTIASAPPISLPNTTTPTPKSTHNIQRATETPANFEAPPSLPTRKAQTTQTAIPEPQNGFEWSYQLTDFQGSRFDVWQKIVQKIAPRMTWADFKEAVVLHNSQLIADNYVFMKDKTYVLPVEK